MFPNEVKWKTTFLSTFHRLVLLIKKINTYIVSFWEKNIVAEALLLVVLAEAEAGWGWDEENPS